MLRMLLWIWWAMWYDSVRYKFYYGVVEPPSHTKGNHEMVPNQNSDLTSGTPWRQQTT